MRDDFLLKCKYNSIKTSTVNKYKNSFVNALTSYYLNNKELNEIIDELHIRGFTCYLVGGMVRDIFLDESPGNPDITVKGISLKELKSYLNTKGEIVNHRLVENHIGLITRDGKIDFNIPNKIVNNKTVFDKRYTISDHLNSSDYTINAIAIDLKYYLFHSLKNTSNDLFRRTLKRNYFKKLNKCDYSLKQKTSKDLFRGFRFMSKFKNMNFDEETFKYYKKNFGNLLNTHAINHFQFEMYYVLANKYSEKTIELLVTEGLFDSIIEKYISDESWLEKSNNYSLNLPKKNTFLLSNTLIEYGEFKKKGWFAFKSLENPLVKKIIQDIKISANKSGYEIFFDDEAKDYFWELDITLKGPFKPYILKKVLEDITQIGFQYHFFINVYYMYSEHSREYCIYSNYFKKNETLNEGLKDSCFEKDGLYWFE